MFQGKSFAALLLAAVLASGAPALMIGQGGGALAAGTSVQSAITSLLNAERAKRGLRPLQPDSKLNRAAASHARDMDKRAYFAHQSPEGRTHVDRITAAGYCRASTAENLAKGYRTAERVIAGWMNSAGHRKNMLNRKYTRFGISKVNGYWVMTLAGPCV